MIAAGNSATGASRLQVVGGGDERRPGTVLQAHGRDARATCDGADQKLKVSVTRLLRPGWVKRGRSARVRLSSRTSCQCQYWRSVRL